MQIDSTVGAGAGSGVSRLAPGPAPVARASEERIAAPQAARVELSTLGKSLARLESDERIDKDGTASASDASKIQSGVEDAQSFVFGALGLDDPKAPPKPHQNGFYTVGKWVSAAASAGALISLLV